jgi:hypothetical protein
MDERAGETVERQGASRELLPLRPGWS